MEDRIIITNQFVRKDKKKNLLRRKVSEEVKLPGKSWKTVSAPHDGSKLHSGNKHFKSWSLVFAPTDLTKHQFRLLTRRCYDFVISAFL